MCLGRGVSTTARDTHTYMHTYTVDAAEMDRATAANHVDSFTVNLSERRYRCYAYGTLYVHVFIRIRTVYTAPYERAAVKGIRAVEVVMSACTDILCALRLC